jgi:glycosyltransferase involved in cell wall biosynthesis
VHRELSDARLLLVGDGESRDRIAAQIASVGLQSAVEFGGWHEDLSTVYRGIDVLVLSSLNEGTPVAVIEAMAAALPVVATDVGGVAAFREAVRLVPPGDADAAALELGRLAADDGLRARLVEKGRSHALAHTLERETLRVAKFLRDQPSGP